MCLNATSIEASQYSGIHLLFVMLNFDISDKSDGVLIIKPAKQDSSLTGYSALNGALGIGSLK